MGVGEPFGVGEHSIEHWSVAVVRGLQGVEQREDHPVVHHQVRGGVGWEQPDRFHGVGEGVPAGAHLVQTPRDEGLAAGGDGGLPPGARAEQDRLGGGDRVGDLPGAAVLVGEDQPGAVTLRAEYGPGVGADDLVGAVGDPRGFGVTAAFQVREFRFHRRYPRHLSGVGSAGGGPGRRRVGGR